VLAQKHTLVAWATTRAESSGRASAHLVWASQARLGESISVYHCSYLHNAYTHPTGVPANPDIHRNAQTRRIHKPRQYKLKHTTQKVLASLTWKGNKSFGSQACEHNSPRTNRGAERILKQKYEMGYLEALTERNEKEQQRRVLLATVLTWSGEQLRASLKMAENLTLTERSVWVEGE